MIPGRAGIRTPIRARARRDPRPRSRARGSLLGGLDSLEAVTDGLKPDPHGARAVPVEVRLPTLLRPHADGA